MAHRIIFCKKNIALSEHLHLTFRHRQIRDLTIQL